MAEEKQMKKTPNAQRRTPNEEKCREPEFDVRSSALAVRRLLPP
jgi:hypothetical protein